MANRILIALLLTCIVLPATRVRAQQQDGPTPEQIEMREQMQQMREQIMRNMQERGIDPMEMFGQIREQMMDGTFDPAAFQQQLVDKGLIDEQMVTRMQTTVQRFTMGNLKQQLKASDDDWKVIEPKLQKVVALRTSVGQSGGFNPMAGFMGGQFSPSDVTKALSELRAALKDPASKPETIAAKLKAWREARDHAKSDLDKAQADLVGVLTVRQEGVLMSFGLIQ